MSPQSPGKGAGNPPSAAAGVRPALPAPRAGTAAPPLAYFVRPLSRGFTLIELLVALAVIGLALALIVGYRAPWSRSLSLKGTAAALASELRLARSEAISRNRAVAFVVDLAGHRYRVGDGALHPLPPRMSVALLTVAGERLGARAGAIRFNPDGSSTGGRITLAEGRQRIAIGVDWLTGRVSVADGR